jgi:hypothetical protein
MGLEARMSKRMQKRFPDYASLVAYAPRPAACVALSAHRVVLTPSLRQIDGA